MSLKHAPGPRPQFHTLEGKETLTIKKATTKKATPRRPSIKEHARQIVADAER
ncbi:MAG TPA: hypothetical protein VE713_18755 [Pyrinomonadaceae bacterium]|jgi:hypothetical protein|nr:hypothetical protein [Pyrinomonadaceae bacterium]